ncbi:CHAT domain-containing protein [Phormidium sp. CLA17]|uniref:CHAT domain-containing protein n=1 Tax=Leptolyngbya sp. Cla-17 TaxID=2803751 RepID=UPI001490F160|nr:CHAT domain-containing protein [Leptolyngbya sp. Cla-17]MBM0740882.1 CHAT domain-containing protein [Leptolyngbya sp. Cla-17]
MVVPRVSPIIRRILRFSLCVMLGALLSSIKVASAPAQTGAIASPQEFEAATSITSVQFNAATDEPLKEVQVGKAYYQSGQYTAAVGEWLPAAQAFASRGDRVNQAVVLSNLALAYQQLGQWSEGNQAIADGIAILNTEQAKVGITEAPALLAQAFNIRGSLQLAQGQAEPALLSWQMATAAYQRAKEPNGIIRSQINQSQALRALGLYPRAKSTLEQVNQTLITQTDSLLKAAGLLNYGDALRLAGELTGAEKVLAQSLAIAQRLQSPSDITLALMGLGNTARARQDSAAALQYYQQAASTSNNPATTVQAKLNQLRLLAELNQTQSVQSLAAEIRPQLETLPPNRTTIYARVNFVQSLIKGLGTAQPSSLTPEAKLLATAVNYAKQIGDQRAESYALGYLGELYERTEQQTEAQKLTEQALILAQAVNAPDVAYRWQWQLGRALKEQGQQEKAIAAYSQAVVTLNSIRNDLVASSPDIQFSFRESVEPVYREFVALLLDPVSGQGVNQANLQKAREVIESLQLAELDNFFKEACLTGRPAQVDQVDPKSAVVYPIILPNRLEVVLSIPKQPLRHYATQISQKNLENLVDRMQRSLRRTSSSRERLAIASQLYDLLIRPAEADLAASDVKTLAFVLDGSIKNLPMAALYDGRQYLIEKYSVALTPGLQLLDPRPLQSQQLKVLIGGLSEERQGFSALPGVEAEVQQITAEVPTQVLFNQTFTTDTFQTQISGSPFRVVHLATHGQFSSDADNTFILTYDRRIDVKQLGELLQARAQETQIPIELLVLSACQTAAGDRRAALGLAGVAVRSGARSTLATLWAVDDQSTSSLMVGFYQELARSGTTKAEALRQSQLKLLQRPEFRHPFFWAPYVLVGNWL